MDKLGGNKQSSVPLVPLSRPPEQNNQYWQEGQNFLTLAGMLLVKVIFFGVGGGKVWGGGSADLDQKSCFERNKA